MHPAPKTRPKMSSYLVRIWGGGVAWLGLALGAVKSESTAAASYLFHLQIENRNHLPPPSCVYEDPHVPKQLWESSSQWRNASEVRYEPNPLWIVASKRLCLQVNREHFGHQSLSAKARYPEKELSGILDTGLGGEPTLGSGPDELCTMF